MEDIEIDDLQKENSELKARIAYLEKLLIDGYLGGEAVYRMKETGRILVRGQGVERG